MTKTTKMLPLAEALRQAVQKDDIEQACDLLQTSLGVTDGGVAGVCFSDVAIHPEEDGIDWSKLDPLTRHARLCDYIKTEVNFMAEPEGARLELAGFETYHTGGGCMSLARHLPDGSRWLVTDEGGTEIPSPDEKIGVGHYGEDGEILFEKTYPDGQFDKEAFLELVEKSSRGAPKIYDRDGMVDDNERRAFVEEQEIDEEALEAFRATRKQMSARAFGELIGDAMWEDDETSQFLVYDDAWYIEICDDGDHMLILGNQCWITREGITLEELERKLYDFAKDETG